MSNVKTQIEASGYVYNPPPDVVPNSLKALKLTELARERGLHEAVHNRLMHAYWSEAANHRRCRHVARPLRGGRARSCRMPWRRWPINATASAIHSATREANKIGVNAIPAFVLDNRLLLVGAYPHDMFEKAFAQLAETPVESYRDQLEARQRCDQGSAHLGEAHAGAEGTGPPDGLRRPPRTTYARMQDHAAVCAAGPARASTGHQHGAGARPNLRHRPRRNQRHRPRPNHRHRPQPQPPPAPRRAPTTARARARARASPAGDGIGERGPKPTLVGHS